MLQDFIEIVWECVISVEKSEVISILLPALLLGGGCWIACCYYTWLWNKRFHIKIQHHLLCCMAAVLTVLFMVTYSSVNKIELIVDEMIDQWSRDLVDDSDWNNQTYEIAFYSVKELFPNQLSQVPEPGKLNSYIPFNNDMMIQVCVEKYVEEACADFSTLHPFFDWMLHAFPGISEKEIQEDILFFFQNYRNESYPLNRAVVIASMHIREGLFLQTPKIVRKTRWILILLFVLIQLIPFGTIGYCAYKDLEIGTNQWTIKQ